MQGRILLLFIGALILIPSIWGTVTLIPAILQWASGNGDRAPGGCPMIEGYACTYRQKVEAGWWAYLFDAVGIVLVLIGVRKILDEKRKAVINK